MSEFGDGRAVFQRVRLWNLLWFSISTMNRGHEPWARETSPTPLGMWSAVARVRKSHRSMSHLMLAGTCLKHSWCGAPAEQAGGPQTGFPHARLQGAAPQRVVLSSAAWKGSPADAKIQRRKVGLSPTGSYPKQQNLAGRAQHSITFCDCGKTCPQHHGLDQVGSTEGCSRQQHTEIHHSRDRDYNGSNLGTHSCSLAPLVMPLT